MSEEATKRGGLESADRIVAFEGDVLRERIRRSQPRWANRPLRPWDEMKLPTPTKTLRQLLLLSILMNASSVMAAPRVEVFTDRDHPVTRTEAFADTTLRVYHLDGLVLAKKKLSEGLPANESQAAKIAGKRFEAQRPTLAPRMMEAGEGIVQAFLTYRLDRYPAIVFDGKSVIYGITDLAVARRLFEVDQGAGGRR